MATKYKPTSFTPKKHTDEIIITTNENPHAHLLNSSPQEAYDRISSLYKINPQNKLLSSLIEKYTWKKNYTIESIRNSKKEKFKEERVFKNGKGVKDENGNTVKKKVPIEKTQEETRLSQIPEEQMESYAHNEGLNEVSSYLKKCLGNSSKNDYFHDVYTEVLINNFNATKTDKKLLSSISQSDDDLNNIINLLLLGLIGVDFSYEYRKGYSVVVSAGNRLGNTILLPFSMAISIFQKNNFELPTNSFNLLDDSFKNLSKDGKYIYKKMFTDDGAEILNYLNSMLFSDNNITMLDLQNKKVTLPTLLSVIKNGNSCIEIESNEPTRVYFSYLKNTFKKIDDISKKAKVDNSNDLFALFAQSEPVNRPTA